MIYNVIFSHNAAKQFKKLDKVLMKRMQHMIDKLQHEPRPNGVKKLVGKHSLYRLRVGKFRIIYEVQNQELIVLILTIADRKEVYSKKILK